MFMNKRKEHGITVTTHTMAWIAYFKSTNSAFFHDIRKECSAPKCNTNLNKSNLGKNIWVSVDNFKDLYGLIIV